MSIKNIPGIPELQEVLDRISRGVKDPAASRRALDRLNRGREELRQKIGTVDLALELLRETRDR